MSGWVLSEPHERLSTQDRGIVRILDGRGGSHVGMGILIGPSHVLTCAHVVNSAIGRPKMAGTAPDRECVVHMELPLLGETLRGSGIVGWKAPDLQRTGDLAMIELSQEAPSEAGLAIIADVAGMSIRGDQLRVFGYRGGNQIGAYADSVFHGQVSRTRLQINTANPPGAFLEGGYSGAAVWDHDQDAVVGMASDLDIGTAHPVAYALGVREIKGFVPGLPVERRWLFPAFGRTWSILALVLFITMLLHVIHVQTRSDLGTLLFWAPTQPIAKLFGTIFFALLAPPLFALLLLHARAMRLHPWWQRVPGLSWRRWNGGLQNTRVSAILMLLAFVLAPMGAQWHLIKELHQSDVRVSVNPLRFGYDLLQLPVGSTCSDEPGVIKCEMPGVDLYGLLQPVNGAAPNIFDNAYSLGGENLARSTSFLPLYEPLAIYTLTAAAAILALLSLWTIFRPPQRFSRTEARSS